MKGNTRGFTLLELLVVVVIIGILAGLAMPRFIKGMERARSAEARSNAGDLRGSEIRYDIENGTPLFGSGAALDDLDTDNPNNTTPRYFDYAVQAAPGPCTTDATSDFYIVATRTDAAGRPEPPDPIAKDYHVVLSEDGNICDDM